MPAVFNKYAEHPDDCVSIMRPSKWGNPFVMGRDGDRDFVCDAFERETMPLLDDIWLLRGKNLLCCCAPKRCHGDCMLKSANRPLFDVSNFMPHYRRDLSKLIWKDEWRRHNQIAPGNFCGDIRLPLRRSIRVSIDQWCVPWPKVGAWIWFSAEGNVRATDDEINALCRFGRIKLDWEQPPMVHPHLRRFLIVEGVVAKDE